MADPTLKKVRGQIKYWSSDGFKADLITRAGEGVHHLKTGEPVPPEKALINLLDESLRLLMLFGFEVQADETIADVKKRMADWQAKRNKEVAHG